MSHENTFGNKGKFIKTLIILILVIGGGIYYYFNSSSKAVSAIFEQLKEQGLVFTEWKKNSDGTYSLIDPKLQVNANLLFNAENINVAIKNDSLLDISLKNVSYKNNLVELSLPNITLVDYKLNNQKIDERLKDKISSFAYNFLSNNFKSFILDNISIKFTFLESGNGVKSELHIKNMEFLDNYNGVISSHNIDKFNISFQLVSDNGKEILVKQNIQIERLEVKDVNLILNTLMVLLSSDKPDQAFEKISGPITYKNYKIEQTDYNQNVTNQIIEELVIDNVFMRYSKRPPIDILTDWVEFIQSAINSEKNKQEYKIDYPKLFGLIRDTANIIDMVGPFKQVVKKGKSDYQLDNINFQFSIDEILTEYQSFNYSVEYKGLQFDFKQSPQEDEVFLKINVGLLGIKDFDIKNFFNLAISELDKISKLENPQNNKEYFLGLMLNAGKFYPKIGRIEIKNFDLNMPSIKGFASFDEISLTNKYTFASSIPTSVDINVINYQQFFRELSDAVEIFGLDDGLLKYSMHIGAVWDEKDKKITLNNSFLETNLTGRVDLDLTISQVQPYFFSGNIIELVSAASGFKVKDFKIKIDDQGRLKIYKDNFAKIRDTKSEEIGYEAISFVVSYLKFILEDMDLREGLIAPIAQFINNGGVISIEAKSKKSYGVSLADLLNLIKKSNRLEPLFELFNISISNK